VGAPQIPYIKVPEIPLPFPSPFDSIKPFGLLVAIGVYLGSVVAIRRARQRGLDLEKMNTFIFYVVGVGFIGAHVFDAIFYTPEELAKDPLYLIKLWKGLSSYGGFFGAIFGLFLYKWKYKESVIGFADTVCSAFPLAWVFGRMGCATVHDHPGRLTTSALGVQYFHPEVRNKDVWGLLSDPNQVIGRFDLGLIEMLLTVPLAVAFHFLWKSKPRPFGFFAGWMSIAYAPVRFILDFFRIEPGDPIPAGVSADLAGMFQRHTEADPRYLGLTPAQYACFILLGIGVLLVKFSKYNPAPASWAEVTPWEPPAEDEPEDEKPVPTKAEKTAAGAEAPRRRRRRDALKTSTETPAAKRQDEKSAEKSAEKKPAKKPAKAPPPADADDEGAQDADAEGAKDAGDSGKKAPADQEDVKSGEP
jgi:phosphatidylglycerol:prolipoprotein diacylglycerol transferase